MSGIQYSSLSDDEFERQVYMTMVMGALPHEIAKELAVRIANNKRDREQTESLNNPKQQPLPFTE
jgi:FixJ family two-component response regulator